MPKVPRPLLTASPRLEAAAPSPAQTKEPGRTGRHGRPGQERAVAPCASPRARAPQLNRKRTDLLDDSPTRPRITSPVSAPLVYHPARPAAAGAGKGTSPDEPKRKTERLAKRQKEALLWKAHADSHGAEHTRNAIWAHYQGLVRYIAERMKTKLPANVDLNELISSGNLGLYDAIRKFDQRRGVRFETFCVPRIRGAMLDAIRSSDWVPRLIRNKAHQFERIVARLATRLGREPGDEELARHMHMKPCRLGKLRRELDVKSQISYESGKERADNREPLRLEMFQDPGVQEPTRGLQEEELRRNALRGLQPNERWVVEQYYFRNRSMKAIGEDLKLSESRICQIHAQVLEVLRRKFRAYADSTFVG